MTAIQTFIAYAFLLVFLIAPLVLMVGQAFVYQGGTSFRWFVDLLSSPEYVSFTSRGGRLFEVRRGVMYLWGHDYGILLNSLLVAFFVTVFCSIIGVVAAMLMGRYRFPGKGIFRVLLLIPLLATPFVNAYIIGKLFNPRGGLINYLLVDLLHILPWRLDIDGLVGVILAQTLSYYPIIFLNVLASLNNIDPSVEEMAENLGARGLRLFRTITLPLFLPGLAAGAIIVFIFSLEDLGAPIGFTGARANPLSRKLVSYQVYSSFAEALTGSFSPKIAALAVIILFIAVAGFLIIRRYVNLRTYAMLSKGGRWSPRLRTPSVKTRVAIILSLLFLVTLASMPQIGTVILATSNWAISGTLPTKATGQYLGTLISDSDVTRAIVNSLLYSGAAVVITVLVGASIAYVVARRDIPGRSVLDILATIPVAVPGIALAVGYFLLFSSKMFRGSILDPLLDPALLMVFAYSIRRLPFTTRAVSAGLAQVDKSLEESSMNLGADRPTTFFKVVLPLIIGHILGGAILSFVYSMSEVSTSVTLGALREDRVPITFFISQIVYGVAAVGSVSIGAALCVLLMAVQITAMAISNYILKQKVAFLGV
ncbi:iron ABC transporter permease [Candidatus Bathyarchaeota archaeon]|nr:iron ABC transporter permease [Candidatus Bathyarchaeota archaeon]MBL7080089.1 iron ABC transporter permease [Candidatus Bathyarchaeota archaeon]